MSPSESRNSTQTITPPQLFDSRTYCVEAAAVAGAGGDARSDLMAAIRQAGGGARLRPATSTPRKVLPLLWNVAYLLPRHSFVSPYHEPLSADVVFGRAVARPSRRSSVGLVRPSLNSLNQGDTHSGAGPQLAGHYFNWAPDA
ncbi:hypothetical protein EVAR_28406_1 [Eumeta japonica]|uniref:WH2 domain-containing protein n=1 Tax=Eumeta variegata TaxID=151549 RepID=A0A4C1V7U8_EUMVA|nr:hypothetical protein EVAR_28406_1 [Eumeta japonica]